MNREFIRKHWYAYIYEQMENQTNDADFLLQVLHTQLGDLPRQILEVACGGGRLTIPLARAGHDITGFDADEYMLLRCYARLQGMKNARLFATDAVKGNWGTGYDVAVMGGNFLINIESDIEYAKAQEAVIRNCASALKTGGYLLMDFDIHYDPAKFFTRLGESSYFHGTDDLGTYGRTVSYGSVYNPVTQICTGSNHTELTTNTGEFFTVPGLRHKHIPSQEQVWDWCVKAGFSVEKTYKNYTQDPIPVPIDETTSHATLLLKKI